MTPSNIPGRLSGFLNKFFVTFCASAGVYRCLREYLLNRSLWHDEATLALNIVNKSFSQLMTMPLDNATAPLGFVLLSKMGTLAGGNSEYALRFIPLLAGVGSFILFIFFLRRYGNGRAMPLALILFSLSYVLWRYATEFKPYSLDVLIALGMLWAGMSTLSRRFDFQRAFQWGVGGGVSLWFSFPAVFVLGGVGVALLARFVATRSWKELRNLGIASALWFLSFSVFYSCSLRYIAGNVALENYWTENFMPFPWESGGLLWLYNSWMKMFDYPAHILPALPALMAFTAGSYAVLKRNGIFFLMLLMPLVFTLAASAMHRYPFSDRFLLFYMPVIYFLVSEGLTFLMRQNALILKAWGYVSAVVILSFKFIMAPLILSSSTVYTEEIKPVLRHIQNNSRDEDILYVYAGAVPAFNYYSKVYGLTENHRYVPRISSRENWEKYREDVAQLKSRARVWIIFAHVYSGAGGKDEETYIVEYLESIGTRIDGVKAEGASAYLFDLASDPRR